MKPQGERAKKQAAQSREVRDEAQRIHEFTVFNEELAGKLISRFVRKVKDEAERGNLRFDYQAIATALAVRDPATRGGKDNWPRQAMYKRYEHHFDTGKAKRVFFAAIDSAAKRYVADIVFYHADAALHSDDECRIGSTFRMEGPALRWADALLPRDIAPHVLRQWTLNSTRTRTFLAALFTHFRRFHDKGSTGRRAILVAQGALKQGWKPQAHVTNLVATGDVKLDALVHRRDDLEEETAEKKEVIRRSRAQQAATIGRHIRRLREAAKGGKNAR